MDFYINEFDKNENIKDIIDISIKKLSFSHNGDNIIVKLENEIIYSFPIFDLTSEIDYQGAKQERYRINKFNIRKHIDFLNFTLENCSDSFNIVGIIFSNTEIRKSLRIDICFKTNFLPKIIFPEFSDPIID